MKQREHITRPSARTAEPAANGGRRSEEQSGSPTAAAAHSFGRVKVTPAGNRMQMRPRIGSAHDPLEREADAIATSVTGTKDPFPTGGRRDDGAAAAPDAAERLGSGSQLPDGVRRDFESRLGYDFSDVRVHTDDGAAQAALAMQARAFTLGSDIAFAPGHFEPATPSGQWLLAHELTHVAQQGSAPAAGAHAASVGSGGGEVVQRGFFDDLWSGIQTVGRAIGEAAEAVGGAITTAVEWIAGRVEDAGRWIANLLGDLPARLLRFGEAVVSGLAGALSIIPEAIGALISGGITGFGDWLWQSVRAGARWVHNIVTALFDLIGGPELFEFALHMFSHATPLTSEEIDAGKLVLGDDAINWGDVRVGEGGILALIFALNGGRAFTTFHTINIPSTGDHSRSNRAIMVHELTHVYQFELVGSRYLGEAIHAQVTIGYGYGGAAGLASDRAAGRHFRDYNREQQAQIAQDYYTLLESAGSTTDYDPFIAELKAGEI